VKRRERKENVDFKRVLLSGAIHQDNVDLEKLTKQQFKKGD